MRCAGRARAAADRTTSTTSTAPTAEPSSHDIAQVTTIRGGARAVDFDRSGGFSIDSVSKSGTNRFTGEVGWQVSTSKMVAALQRTSASRFEQDRSWFTVNAGGPVIPGKLNFYGSYYRPRFAYGGFYRPRVWGWRGGWGGRGWGGRGWRRW